MNADKILAARLAESIELASSLGEATFAPFLETVDLVVESLSSGGKLLVFGNGGSAADAQHIAAELVGRFQKERPPLAAAALTVNTSNLTGIANDYGFESVFSRQIEALGRKGDVALGISTSGASKNVLAALRKARQMGMGAVALVGADTSAARCAAEIVIPVPSKVTARVQEVHIFLGHVLCEIVESRMNP